jgi:hypothetical protein
MMSAVISAAVSPSWVAPASWKRVGRDHVPGGGGGQERDRAGPLWIIPVWTRSVVLRSSMNQVWKCEFCGQSVILRSTEAPLWVFRGLHFESPFRW